MPIICQNKEATHHYKILETYEAGIALSGPEVKSAKKGQVSLKGSYVGFDKNNEAWLFNCHISAYGPAKGQQLNYDPGRKRKLLLRKKEISSLMGKSKQRGLTIIPLSLYTKKRLIKAEIALVKGKSKIDKRETIKKREIEREIRGVLKNK